MNTKKVGQLILIAIKFGRIEIKIDKSWILPFSLYIYKTKTPGFNINTSYRMLEIHLIRINIIFCILEE